MSIVMRYCCEHKSDMDMKLEDHHQSTTWQCMKLANVFCCPTILVLWVLLLIGKLTNMNSYFCKFNTSKQLSKLYNFNHILVCKCFVFMLFLIVFYLLDCLMFNC
jgi:hypothetical protein